MTVGDYLNQIPDENIRARALKNLYVERRGDRAVSIAHAIFVAFLWHHSTEKYSYWKAVHHNFKYPDNKMKVPKIGSKK